MHLISLETSGQLPPCSACPSGYIAAWWFEGGSPQAPVLGHVAPAGGSVLEDCGSFRRRSLEGGNGTPGISLWTYSLVQLLSFSLPPALPRWEQAAPFSSAVAMLFPSPCHDGPVIHEQRQVIPPLSRQIFLSPKWGKVANTRSIIHSLGKAMTALS